MARASPSAKRGATLRPKQQRRIRRSVVLVRRSCDRPHAQAVAADRTVSRTRIAVRLLHAGTAGAAAGGRLFAESDQRIEPAIPAMGAQIPVGALSRPLGDAQTMVAALAGLVRVCCAGADAARSRSG